MKLFSFDAKVKTKTGLIDDLVYVIAKDNDDALAKIASFSSEQVLKNIYDLSKDWCT